MRWWWLPALLVAAAAGVTVLALGGASSNADLPTLEVRRGAFVRTVEAEGLLEAVTSTPLGPPVNAMGPVKIGWLIEDGTRVDDGDVVCRFDPTELEETRADASADLEIADAELDKAAAERGTTLSNLDLDASLAEDEAELARRFQADDVQLYSRHEILESTVDTELAEARAQHARSLRDVEDRRTRVDRELVEIQRAQAEQRIAQADEGLEQLQVTAPHAGIVVLERDWRGEIPAVGDMVWPGRPIATIPDLGRMQAIVFVLETDAGGLEPGQPATVVLEAHPGVEVAATVRQVEPVAQRRRRNDPLQYFQATLELERTDSETMKPGQRIRASITLDELADVITLPRQAVVRREGSTVVYRREGSGFEPVRVSLGPASLAQVVIRDGLEPGDVIALADPSAHLADDRAHDALTPVSSGGARP
jgi:RND family efflux transporter MFP subunit